MIDLRKIIWFYDKHLPVQINNRNTIKKKKNMLIVNNKEAHGTIIRTEIICKKIPLQKSIEFGMALK